MKKDAIMQKIFGTNQRNRFVSTVLLLLLHVVMGISIVLNGPVMYFPSRTAEQHPCCLRSVINQEEEIRGDGIILYFLFAPMLFYLVF
jgi:hypothetical protein